MTEYWDRVAGTKGFTHPVPVDLLKRSIAADDPILDYGCGYGRAMSLLLRAGFTRVVGMTIPYPDCSFGAVLLIAVLTCIPGTADQRRIIGEAHRVLRDGGVLYVSDYPMQADSRNEARYREFASEFPDFGTFRLPDGGVVRHFEISYIRALLAGFEIERQVMGRSTTMNGNDATIFQIVARKSMRSFGLMS